MTDRVPLLTGYGDTLAGDVQLDAELEGTLDAPTVDARVEAWGLAQATIPEPVPPRNGLHGAARRREARLGAWGLLVDADAHVTYDGREARLDGLHVRHERPRGGQRLRPRWRCRSPTSSPAGRTRRATSRSTLDQVPLGEVPYFADLDVGGHLSGTLTHEGHRRQAQLHVDLQPARPRDRPRLSSTTAPTSSVDVPEPAGESQRGPRAAVALSGRAGGELAVQRLREGLVGARGARAGARPGPPGRAHADREALPRRGRRAVRAEEDREPPRRPPRRHGAHRVERARRAPLRSTPTSRSATARLDLPQIGQRLHDVSARIAGGARRDGEAHRLQARGGTGLIRGSGSASFERWAWRCADVACLRQAKVELTVASKERIPLTFDGVPVGDAYGKVGLEAKSQDRRLALTVTPDLRVAAGSVPRPQRPVARRRPRLHRLLRAEAAGRRAPDLGRRPPHDRGRAARSSATG